MHSGKYDYSSVTSYEAGLKLKIKCPKHGYFYQSASCHLAGRGCKKCANEGLLGWHKLKGIKKNPSNAGKQCYFYVVEVSKLDGTESCLKYGITTRTVKERYSSSKREGILVSEIFNISSNLLFSAELEKITSETMSDMKTNVTGSLLKGTYTAGSSECFDHSGLHVVYNIIKEFFGK